MTSVLRCLLLVLLSGSALAATPLPTPAHGGTVRYGYTDVTLDLRAPTAAALIDQVVATGRCAGQPEAQLALLRRFTQAWWSSPEAARGEPLSLRVGGLYYGAAQRPDNGAALRLRVISTRPPLTSNDCAAMLRP